MKIVCALGLLALLALGIAAEIYFLIGFAAFFLALLAVGPRFDYWLMRRRWRRHPQFNELLRVEATDTGLTFSTSKTSGNASWSAYTGAISKPLGVLLYSTKWDYLWLPDDAIVEGTTEELRNLLRSKLTVQDAV